MHQNKYYGKDGKEVNEDTYHKECDKYKCEKVDNVYYDDKGNVVTKAQYEDICGIENPQTGNKSATLFILLGLFAILGMLGYAKKNNVIAKI